MLLARTALCAALVGTLLVSPEASAQREATRDALDRLEETLSLKLEHGGLSRREVLPLIVVSVAPAYEESRAWYPAAALSALIRVFGEEGLRACEACMAPRLYVEQGRLEQVTTSPGAAEIIRLDENTRGEGPPARAAIWVDETPAGVAVRLIDLKTSRIVLAENLDAGLTERARTHHNVTLTEELERRARGDALTHTFFDATLYPGQHASMDWVEQWGDTNANLSGVSLSLYDPVIGVGAAYYRVVPRALNIMVGAKVLMSVPTALVQSITQEDVEVIDRILTGVFIVRVPIATSNYALTFSASTNGQVGVGVSLLNLSLLPVIP